MVSALLIGVVLPLAAVAAVVAPVVAGNCVPENGDGLLNGLLVRGLFSGEDDKILGDG